MEPEQDTRRSSALIWSPCCHPAQISQPQTVSFRVPRGPWMVLKNPLPWLNILDPVAKTYPHCRCWHWTYWLQWTSLHMAMEMAGRPATWWAGQCWGVQHREAGHVAAPFFLPICLADGHLNEDGARAGHMPIISSQLVSMLPYRTDKPATNSILSSS